MITDPWFYAAAIPAILLTCIAKSAFGIGLGILAVPLIALTLPIGPTAGILLPLLLLMDAFGLWLYWRRWDLRILFALLPGSLLGLAAGTVLFRLVPESVIRVLLGAIAVSFTAHWFLRAHVKRPPFKPSAWLGWLAGGTSGFTSFVSHAGAPPVALYLLPLQLDKTVYTATVVLYFALVNAIKLAPYAWLGLLPVGNLETAAVLAPLVPLGIWLGWTLHRALSMNGFYRICYGMVLLAGIKLLYDGLLPWL